MKETALKLCLESPPERDVLKQCLKLVKVIQRLEIFVIEYTALERHDCQKFGEYLEYFKSLAFDAETVQ